MGGELWAQAGSHPLLFDCEAINLSRHARPFGLCMGSAPFRSRGLLPRQLVQTRRSFLRMAGKISPMPTASTDPNSELTHNFNPSFQKKWPPSKNWEGNHRSCNEIAKT
jgi:hypothetical protein